MGEFAGYSPSYVAAFHASRRRQLPRGVVYQYDGVPFYCVFGRRYRCEY